MWNHSNGGTEGSFSHLNFYGFGRSYISSRELSTVMFFSCLKNVGKFTRFFFFQNQQSEGWDLERRRADTRTDYLRPTTVYLPPFRLPPFTYALWLMVNNWELFNFFYIIDINQAIKNIEMIFLYISNFGRSQNFSIFYSIVIFKTFFFSLDERLFVFPRNLFSLITIF